MATRRKKASARARKAQGSGRKAKTRAKKARQKTPPKVRRQKSVARKTQKSSRRQRPAKKTSRAAPKKTKAKKRKRAPKTRTPKLVVRIQKGFHALRKTALKKEKLVLPKFTRRKGKLRLRGTQGKERTLIVEDFWEKLREGHWEIRANRAFESLWRDFAQSPTLYARFTFTVTKVNTLLTAGSPKLVRSERKKIIHWFFSTGLSYSLEGMRHQFQVGWDTLAHTILDAQRDNIESAFFLEYITCIAYVVKA